MNRLDTPPSQIEEEQQPSTLSEFPEDARETISGLVWLGFIEKTTSFMGHDFTLRTLRAGEDLQVGLLTKQYADTYGREQAVAVATVALALKEVDGDPDWCPNATNSSSSFQQRFRAVQDWYLPTVFRLFDTYMELLQEQQLALERVEDLSTGSLSTFTPSSDSLNERDDLEVEPISPDEMAAIADSLDSNED